MTGHACELERELEAMRSERDVLVTVIRTGYVPRDGFTQDEIIRRTAGIAVQLHEQIASLQKKLPPLKDERPGYVPREG